MEGVRGSLVYTETEGSGKGAGVAGVYLRVLEVETVLRIAVDSWWLS